MVLGDGDLKKIGKLVEGAIAGEANRRVITEVVEGAIAGEANRRVITEVVEGAINQDKYLEKIGKVVDEKIFQALDGMVLPELMKLEKKMATKDDLVNLKTKMDEKIDGVEERLTNRIDKVGEIVTDTRTNHERRIRRLEDEVGVEPEARLTL